jgi:sodium/bile acid cotransporter 7
MQRFLPDWFLTGMCVAMFLAWLIPSPGAHGGSLHPELLTKCGIALIFFLHGAQLSFAALKDGVSRWQLHLIIQLTTFLAFPLIGLLLVKLTGGLISPDLALGLFYLCALPSTVSSSVAMTAAAKGNVPVAVFNATISSIIGIVLTPLWMSLLIEKQSGHMDTLGVMLDLVQWLLMPLIIGQALRPIIGKWITKHKKYVSKIDRLTILLLVYTSFCDSFAGHVWSGHGALTMIVTVTVTVVLFFAILGALILLCRKLAIADSYRAAVVFCGTKKSLATGVPMAHLLFTGNPSLGLILLPIMIYHPLQLFVCGPLANHWAKKSAKY